MFVVGPDFWLLALCLAFGAFCVWTAAVMTRSLGKAASEGSGRDGSDALILDFGSWLKVATRSPAVAFFVLGVVAGIGLPAFYAYLYRPAGPNGYAMVTAHGKFQTAVSNVCFQTPEESFFATGYTLRFPRSVKNINYTVEAPGSLTDDLSIELDGSGAWYKINTDKAKPAALDQNGSFDIGDPLVFMNSSQGAGLPKQSAVGQQTTTLSNVLGGQQQ
jgi:hypothetical protein